MTRALHAPVNAAIKPNSEINVSKQACSLFYRHIVAVKIKIKTIPTHSNKYILSLQQSLHKSKIFTDFGIRMWTRTYLVSAACQLRE